MSPVSLAAQNAQSTKEKTSATNNPIPAKLFTRASTLSVP